MYSHICGSRKGGLNTYDHSLPYYPIRLRKKLEKGEVEPLGQCTQREANNYLVKRGASAIKFPTQSYQGV